MPEALERDRYDVDAIHLVAMQDGDVVGTLSCAMQLGQKYEDRQCVDEAGHDRA
ncbi:hypothetical protein NKI32_15030 [Mesorhizobium sp. M0761]|uniref:hypothetical protein n=1 Tax=Mesorhizobium sp. M0761 TaxID=2956994 RepID=UPI003339C783